MAILDKDLNTNEGYFDDDDRIEDPEFAVMINSDGYRVGSDDQFDMDGDYNFG